MPARSFDGTALLVAGFGAQGGTAFDASAVHTLGQIGEALLATGASWQIRRLTATAGERYAADRAGLKRHLDELAAEPVRVAVLVVLGTVIEVGGAPALVTGAQPREYPEDATLPLAWIRERLVGARAEQLVVVLSAHGDATPRVWLEALGTNRDRDLVAVESSAERAGLADAMLAGLCGDALDPRTGTVTMASLAEYLSSRASQGAVQTCEAPETIAQPPPLGGLWDVRRSQLSQRGTRPRAARAPATDDLTGHVLPGRFRIDRLVARGTFGTIYRARQLAVERDVALKVLNADIDPASDDGRLFVHEIRSVGRIDHANVVRIHQADITADGRLFFAMELLDGRDLHRLVEEDGTLPRARALELVRQLLAGLGAAHDAGLVHADIKPANAIVLARDPIERVVLVDFGLSRLRAPDRPSQSAGGTPAYMAPEQMMEGRVDARSDLFSAALVFVNLMTGWRRPNAFTLVPPLAELIPDAALRDVLARALSIDPAKRYQTAAELAAALTGDSAPSVDVDREPLPVLPFRHLAPLTEDDRDRLFGREADLAVLTEHALYRRSVIYTAPSGVGKTSMLRAGLLPRLEALGVRAFYYRVRGDDPAALVASICPESTTITEAITRWHQRHPGKLVLVLDQLESAFIDTDASELVREVLAFDAWPPGADVAVVLTIREDYLARLVARTQELEPGIPIVRLPPLGIDGARDAIVGPLTERRLSIEPELLDALLADLQRAAAAIAPEMGWSSAPAVYPPHLQLACSVLYEHLAPGDVTFTHAHYRELGGFDTIVGEHLERVLDTELADGRDAIARDVFLALVVGQERAMRPEPELLDIVSARHPRPAVLAVLEALRARGLLVRVRTSGEPGWELVHDSLVPRVLAWIDRRDLDRRRAIELLRYHLRRSRPDAPSLLGRAELKELAPYADAIAELDGEWKKREVAAGAWTPLRLVERSRQYRRRRIAVVGSAFVVLATIASVGMYRSHVESERAAAEESLRQRNLGRFTMSLEPFAWDPSTQSVVPVDARSLPMAWRLFDASTESLTSIGREVEASLVVRGSPTYERNARVEVVEARGGSAFLSVARGECPPTLISLAGLPGYERRDRDEKLRILVPVCDVGTSAMVRIPGGVFTFGGPGEPPSQDVLGTPEAHREMRSTLSGFAIDAYEVTNAEYRVFSEMSQVTQATMPEYPPTPHLELAHLPRRPVSGVAFSDALGYCRFLGKDLPTTEQWTRALRGGEFLPDGTLNPHPIRNYPWGTEPRHGAAKLVDVKPIGPADVGSYPQDRSPDGVFDLAGNVLEWTRTPSVQPGFWVVRGGNWYETDTANLVEFMAIDNPRRPEYREYVVGFRCVANSELKHH